ncbi:MAG: F0F1 ATP synthase subunit delta [Patescibacteria group bacterium]|jgi:F-type H+-transporting ATPase subunit delta
MKKINAKKFARVLIDAVEDKSPSETEKIISEFIAYLSEKRLLAWWREISRSIENVWREKYGVANISVISAHPLSEKSRKALEKVAPGADIVETVDPELIGGAIVRIDDRIVDSSVLGSLNSLKQTLVR